MSITPDHCQSKHTNANENHIPLGHWLYHGTNLPRYTFMSVNFDIHLEGGSWRETGEHYSHKPE